MTMTDEERFRFDLTGYLVRPAILSAEEVAAIVDQVERIHHDSVSEKFLALTSTVLPVHEDNPKWDPR